MPFCFMILILLITSMLLAVSTLAVDEKVRVAFGVGTVAAVISVVI